MRGPNLMKGYYLYERPAVLQPPASEVGEGWYDTGDVVEIEVPQIGVLRNSVVAEA